MNTKIEIFVSYSHQNAAYLEKDSLLGFLQGLERDNIKFWTDRQIKAGELWNEVIKSHIQSCDIALVLVSQGFLDSKYCRDVEIKHFLADTKYVFPVILSPCDWQRHAWLANRQFLPGAEQTIEEHFHEAGQRKRLFLKIRQQLLELAQNKGAAIDSSDKPVAIKSKPKTSSQFSGKSKIAFCNRLGKDWKLLADYLEITPAEQNRFTAGDEGRDIWTWLGNRERLIELPDILSLSNINRADLAQLFASNHSLT